jgi:hypothetical protein
LRRIVIIGTALAVLVGAAAAYAAFNNYTGTSVSFSPKGSGTSRAPKIVNMTEILQANAPAGQRAAPLVDIDVRVYGVKTNGNLFPTCTDKQIDANKTKYELACPKQSAIAAGTVNALLGPANNSSQAAGTACNPWLKVFNGGRNTQVFFFTTTTHTPNPSKYTCAGLPTGATAPYDGHISYGHGYWQIDVPLPPDISNKVANTPGLYGSLIKEVLNPITEVKRVGGKLRGYMESTACKPGGKRPYTVSYTADDYNTGTPEHATISGNAPC